MKIDELQESTTAGSVAPVAMPMNGGDAIKRGTGVYKPKKGGNLLTGKKTSKKYANSLHENKMKQIAMDLETMQDGNFKQKYGKTKEKMMSLLGTPSKLKPNSVSEVNETEGANKFSVTYYNPKLDKNVTKTVTANNLSDVWDMCANKGLEVIRVQAKDAKISEAHLEEEDLILVPGQGHRLRAGFHAFDPDKAEHEGETLKNSLRTIIRNARELHARLENSDQFPEWVSEKIGQIKGMMTSVTEYLISSQEKTEGVIAGGGVGEAVGQKYEMRFSNGKTQRFSANTPEEAKKKAKGLGATSLIKVSKDGMPQGKVDEEGKGLWANIHAKRERIKHGSGERMRKPGSKGAPSAQDFKDAANEDEITEGTGAWETRRKTEEGIKEKIKGAVRREKAKDLPLVQTRRDYASGKAGEAYNKGETRKGNQYSAWAEKDRKKKNDPTTNPAGTYRTKTTDYTNESKYGKGVRDCCDSPVQKNQPHVKGCKNYAPSSADRKADMERHNAETIPGYKRNKDIN